jgi:HK97 family phage major capsid protein
MRTKVLREKRLKLITDIRACYKKEDDEKYVWTKEDTDAVARMEAELATVEESLERAEKDEKLSTRLDDLGRDRREDQRSEVRGQRSVGREDFDSRNDPDEDDDDDAPTYRDRGVALQAWFRAGTDEPLTTQQREACRRLNFNPLAKRISLDVGDEGFVQDLSHEYREVSEREAKLAARRMCRERLQRAREERAMSAFDGPSGGYAVPMEFLNRFDENMLDYSGMMQVAEIIRTEGGGEMPWVTSDDTANEGEFIGETQTIDGSTEPTLGQQSWFAFKCHAKMIKVPQELIEDNAFNLVERIGGWLGERLGRIKERKFTLGTGVKQPRGITLDSTLGVTAASATAILFDELISLQGSIDPAYDRNARWMMNRLIAIAIRKLKDTTNNYLWQPSVQAGQPDLLLNRGVTYNSFMQSTLATATKTVFYGDFSKYKVREVRKVRLVRLDERYAELDQVAFDALQRVDGKLLDTGTAPVKHLLQA